MANGDFGIDFGDFEFASALSGIDLSGLSMDGWRLVNDEWWIGPRGERACPPP